MHADVTPTADLPPKLRDRVEAIEITICAFCRATLDDSYEQLCLRVLHDVVARDATTFARGRTEIWAGGVVHLVGQRNGLFNTWSTPQLPAGEIARLLDASQPSINAKSKLLRELLQLGSPRVDDRYHRPGPGLDDMRELVDILLARGDELNDDHDQGLDDEGPMPISERVAMLRQMAFDVNELDAALDPDAPALSRRLVASADALAALGSKPRINQRDEDKLSREGADALVAGHSMIVRSAVRAHLGAERCEKLGADAVFLGELSMCALEDAVALREDSLADHAWHRWAHAHLLRIIDAGYAWGMRHAQPHATTSADLGDALEAELNEIDLIAAYSIGIASPISLVTANAIEHLADTWLASIAHERALEIDDESARHLAGIDSADHDAFEDAFDLGIGLALASQVLDAADGGERPRTFEPTSWRCVIDSATNTTYQLKITLRGVRPPIWRRVEVRGSTTLGELHTIIQAAMGWYDCHLHAFDIAGSRYMPPDESGGFDWDGLADFDETGVRLSDVLGEGEKLRYDYDFGDGWEHTVAVEQITRNDVDSSSAVELPRIVAGRRACPPEDCGGPGGYEDLLRVIADPSDPEHDATREWVGGDFDPESFSLGSFEHALRVHQAR